MFGLGVLVFLVFLSAVVVDVDIETGTGVLVGFGLALNSIL